MYSRESLDDALRVVHAAMPPTPQQRWPLLDARLGAAAWVKHENQTPVARSSCAAAWSTSMR